MKGATKNERLRKAQPSRQQVPHEPAIGCWTIMLKSYAITGWFDELKEVDVDDEAKYTADVKRNAKDFANMVVGDATKVGCAAKQCLKQGFTAAVCKYDKEPQIDTAMYEVGNPCSGCTCDPLGGLCVTP
ncbi:hypothetical protein NECAME_03346 [Necator americanus]|uniref:SCP domain-containing protein n=1 Tax=Necator americanus TaxID=51031 RepID=W2T6P8_NECAM|nr:hypothetical protein NECAME_03346 [Necator americanus]ETN76677.1 hypothetical protein NECAME_03346 [Necator americanus]